MRKFAAAAVLVFLLASPAVAQMGYYSADGSQPSALADANGQPPGQAAQDPGTETEDRAPPQTRQVTSLQKCIDKLGPEDAAEVRLNPVRPYQECLARLSNAAAEKRHIKVSRDKAEPVAETPRNFSRVQNGGPEEEPGAAQQDPADDGGHYWAAAPRPARAARAPAEAEATPGGMPGEEDYGSSGKSRLPGWFPEIKPDNSKGSYNP